MRFLLSTDPGLEDLVEGEIGDREPGVDVESRPYDRPGLVRVDATDVDGLLQLTTIHHVVEVRHEADVTGTEQIARELEDVPFQELTGAASFRVTSRCHGDAGPKKMEIQRAAGAVLHHRYGTPVDLENFAVEVRVDLHGSRLVAGIQRTRDSLGNRIRRARALRSALRPTVAAAMVRLAGAHRGEGALIDPMCGVGTIPVEACRANPRLDVAAADWDRETAAAARETLANHGVDLEVEVADARRLGERFPDRFDFIVTDPPYGLRQAKRTSIARLYRALLPSLARAVRDSGTIVLIVVKYRAFRAALEGTGLRVAQERTVELGGIRPRIFVLRREET
jgi:putative N6-adenine-specific DNA methylase/tRNA (guanine6-N2)-methyltransferase